MFKSIESFKSALPYFLSSRPNYTSQTLSVTSPVKIRLWLYYIWLCTKIISSNIYILNVAALDETIIPSYLHFSMQNIEQSRGLCRASRWSNVNVDQYRSLFINIRVTSFTYRHDVMYRTFVRWLFQHLRYR